MTAANFKETVTKQNNDAENQPLLEKINETKQPLLQQTISSDENDSAELQNDESLSERESSVSSENNACQDKKVANSTEVKEQKKEVSNSTEEPKSDETDYYARFTCIILVDALLTVYLNPNGLTKTVCSTFSESDYWGLFVIRISAIVLIILGLKQKNHWLTFASFSLSFLFVPCWILKSQFLLFSDQWLDHSAWHSPLAGIICYIVQSYWIFYFWFQIEPEKIENEDKEHEKDKKNASPSLVIRKFIQYCSPYWKETLVLFVSIGAQQTADAMSPLIQSYILDDVIGKDGSNMVYYFSLYSLCQVIRIIAHYFHAYYQRYLRIVLEQDVRISVYEAVLKQEVGYFDLNTTGETTSLVFHKVDQASCDFAWYLRSVMEDVIRSIVIVIAAFQLSTKMTLASLMFSPCIVAGFAYFNRHSRRLNVITRKMWKDMERITTEAIQNIRSVKLFACEDYELGEYHERIKKWCEIEMEKCWYDEARWAWCSFVPCTSKIALLYFGLYEVKNENLSVGALTAFLHYSGTINWLFESWGGKYRRFVMLMVQSTKVFKLMDRECKLPRTADKKPEKCEGKIDIEDITFCYPKTPETKVLKKLKFKIQPGEIVALVGESGGGKSSICKALTYSYGMAKGDVKLDGHPVSEYNAKWFANRMTIVPQDSELFARTIKDNISYGLDDCNMEKIQEAAKQANAHDFIMGFTDGYDTVLGERGVTLSGGQKQRVSIARALVRKPNVLLLDEATASLDTKSERLVHKAIDDLFERKEQSMSMMIIAHRLSTVMHADKICVIKEGSVVEVGSHEALLKQNGVYASLVQEQSLFKSKKTEREK